MRKANGGQKTTPCCSKVGIKKGPWTPQEDEILTRYIKGSGSGAWRTLPQRAGLLRCGKSCRLRWMNYLRPNLNRAPIAPDEEDLILRLHRLLGNRWSLIAGRIPGRTDNEIKNYWNTHLSKKLISQGLDPRTHKPLEIYNPNPTCNNQHQKYSMEPNPKPSPPPSPPLALLCQQQSNEIEEGEGEGKGEGEGEGEGEGKASDGMMVMRDYNEDMYFSSFLDSIMMSDECSVFQQQTDDSNQQVLFQDMMMMMQPMVTFDSNQGLEWGSQTHQASTPPLMASGFPYSQTDHVHDRSLHPAEMERKSDQA